MIRLDMVVEYVDCDSEFVRESMDIQVPENFAKELEARIVELSLGRLSLEQAQRLRGWVQLPPLPEECYARLRPRVRLDDLPYKTHTNRELPLMLAGKKPLAVFCDDTVLPLGEQAIPESRFASHVADGRFIRGEFIRESDNRQTKYVLFATKNEGWRIPAYELLRRTADLAGWSAGFERMEGSLLGYSDSENDAYQAFLLKARGN